MLYAEAVGEINGHPVKEIILKTDFISHFMQSAVYCGRITEGGTDGGWKN